MKKNSSPRSVTIEVGSRPFDGFASIGCGSCDVALDLFQPDPMQADRFLATCPDCGEWSLVRVDDGASTFRILSLEPVARELEHVDDRHQNQTTS